MEPDHDQHLQEGRIPFRLRIGVTGHRDLRDPDAAAASIRACLSALQKQFPETETIPVRYTILSALADGADRLLVREAVPLLGKSKVELHAVLPLDTADYRRDFTDPASRAEFDELLEWAAGRIQMPHTDDRDEAYERAGRWVADHSDVVIAVWDGHQPAGRGGTAEIADYARHRGVAVRVIAAARSSQPGQEPQEVDWSASGLRQAALGYQRIKTFNQGSIATDPLRAQIAADDEQPRRAARGTVIERQYESVAAWALPRLARADLLAIASHRWYFRIGAALYLFAALAVTAVAAQSQAGLSPLYALFEVTFMLLIVAILWAGRRYRVHDRWISYRSLAEAFRASMFILMAGAPSDRQSQAGGELPTRDEPWFQRAFSEAWRERPLVVPDPEHTPALRDFLITAWIDDQLAYHRKARERLNRARTRLLQAIFALFGMTIVIGIVHSFDLIGGHTWLKIAVFLAVALPGFGAALTGIRDQRQFRLHEHRSERTAARLELLRVQLESQTSLQSVRRLAAQVQTLLEAENLDWSGVIEFQDLEMVI